MAKPTSFRNVISSVVADTSNKKSVCKNQIEKKITVLQIYKIFCISFSTLQNIPLKKYKKTMHLIKYLLTYAIC